MSPRPRLRSRLAAVLICGAALGGTDCIIPDAGIIVEDEFLNAGAVRIVEPTPVTIRADEDCDELTTLGGCPRVPDTLPSGLIRTDSPLCVCPGADQGLGEFDIYVEDPDVDEDGDPRDDILGALFLDMPSTASDPSLFLAYTGLLAPDEPATRFRASDVQTIERPDPHLKAWTLAGQPRVDLCNDNDGIQIPPGLHVLRLIVTDRPWYTPVLRDADGMVIEDEDGEVVLGDPVVGMPDLAGGASYDTRSYVFECLDSSDPVAGSGCNCES
ncbi:MAG: hypothetical protein AAF799_32025 [Myxococcota bacterium]